MIKIERIQKDREGILIAPDERWQADAIKRTVQAEHEREGHTAVSSIYAHGQVRAALEQLTHYKCAYCETSLDRFDWDVEHFRPKGRVRENPNHPGYYWLAYQWNNLLPACTYCNQNRKERPTFSGRGGGSGGKLDQFPLEDESKRAMDHHADLAQERCLLIDPFQDDPALHLGYLPDGMMFALNRSRKGQTTIDVFRLNLVRTQEMRRKRIKIIIEVLEMRVAARKSKQVKLLTQIERLLASLMADNEQFAGMARFFIKNPVAMGIG